MPRPFDAYSFPARVVPVLVVLMPPLVLLGSGVAFGARSAVASGTILAALSALAAQVGRDRGKRLEPTLWEGWGGSATQRRLRYRGATNADVVSRLHAQLETVLGITLPTAEEEARDATGADARYDEATRRLIALTRDRTRFALLFAENVSYGMRRNLLGLQPAGVVVAAISLLAAVSLLVFAPGEFATRASRYASGAGASAATLVFWVFVVTTDWVRIPAEAYAERLVECVDILAQGESRAAAD